MSEMQLPLLGGGSASLAADAHALRPVRMMGGELRHFTAASFPGGERAGCGLALRRCEAFGYLAAQSQDCWVDVLDSNGDILQEVLVTRRGFEYLRRTLKFVRES
jgi:hypothetical protein